MDFKRLIQDTAVIIYINDLSNKKNMKKKYAYICNILIACCMVSCSVSKKEISCMPNAPKHVIMVGFDGLSSYSLANGAEMPTLRKMMTEGAYTVKNRSVLPSSSAVNWASMFMGAGPELHGYTTWGSKTPDLPSRELNKNGIFPDIFSCIREAQPESELGFIYEWGGMRYLADTLSMDYIQQAPLSETNMKQSIAPVLNYLKKKKPNFCAIIFDKPDGTGHSKGWESQEYLDMLNHLDKALAEIVKTVKESGMLEETIFILTSDHGGIKTGHGGKTMSEMQTPIIFWGKGIKKGFQIPESTMMYDIAGTIGYMFGIEQPQVWIARPIYSIFQ